MNWVSKINQIWGFQPILAICFQIFAVLNFEKLTNMGTSKIQSPGFRYPYIHHYLINILPHQDE